MLNEYMLSSEGKEYRVYDQLFFYDNKKLYIGVKTETILNTPLNN